MLRDYYRLTLVLAALFLAVLVFPASAFADQYSPINTINGIKNGEIFKEGQVVEFSAAGSNATAATPSVGDERYVPDHWELYRAGKKYLYETWSAANYTVRFYQLDKNGYELRVFFRRQSCATAGTWSDAGDFDCATATFSVASAASAPTGTIASPGVLLPSDENATYYSGENANVYIIGSGMDNSSPAKDDIRYRPSQWSLSMTCTSDSSKTVNKSGTFEKAPYVASFTADPATFSAITMKYSGSISVSFIKEIYDGAAWTATETTENLSQELKVDTAVRLSTPTVSTANVTNTIRGIENTQSVELSEDGVKFTVSGQGMDSTSVAEGATRFHPYLWILQNTTVGGAPLIGGWADDSYSTVLSEDMLHTGNSYQLCVRFCGQYYSGGQWVDSRSIADEVVSFSVVEKGAATTATTTTTTTTASTTATTAYTAEPTQAPQPDNGDVPPVEAENKIIYEKASREENMRTLEYYLGGVYAFAFILIIGLIIRRIKLTRDQRKEAEEKLLKAELEAAEAAAKKSAQDAPFSQLGYGYIDGAYAGMMGVDMQTNAAEGAGQSTGGYGQFGEAYENRPEGEKTVEGSQDTEKQNTQSAAPEQTPAAAEPAYSQDYEFNPSAGTYDQQMHEFGQDYEFRPMGEEYGDFNQYAQNGYDPAFVGGGGYDQGYGAYPPENGYDQGYGAYPPESGYDQGYGAYPPENGYDQSYGAYPPDGGYAPDGEPLPDEPIIIPEDDYGAYGSYDVYGEQGDYGAYGS